MRIEYLAETGSTNDYVKRYLADGEDAIVCAERQTGGRGTKGRSFASERGGVYLSALTFYDGVPASEAFRVMSHAAVAVCRTAEAFGAAPEIKWANGVFANGRKLSGILIENGISDGKLRWSVVGIGVNVCNDLSALNGIAISLSEAAGKPVSVEAAREELIRNLRRSDSFDDYLSYLRFLGREVTVVENGRAFCAKAIRVLRDGRLEIEEAGGAPRALSAAEISLKL